METENKRSKKNKTKTWKTEKLIWIYTCETLILNMKP